jgi:hypothetical protein
MGGAWRGPREEEGGVFERKALPRGADRVIVKEGFLFNLSRGVKVAMQHGCRGGSLQRQSAFALCRGVE